VSSEERLQVYLFLLFQTKEVIDRTKDASLGRPTELTPLEGSVERACRDRPSRARLTGFLGHIVSSVARGLFRASLAQLDGAVFRLQSLEPMGDRENAALVDLSGCDELREFGLGLLSLARLNGLGVRSGFGSFGPRVSLAGLFGSGHGVASLTPAPPQLDENSVLCHPISMTSPASVYVVAAARTPIGAFLGSLAPVPGTELGTLAIRGALARSKLAPDAVQEVFMGNVLSAGLGQAPARQAAIRAGIPNTTPATTVSKVCGSGMQAVILGAKTILLGDAEIVVAGGMESMSNAPYYLDKARTGYRMGEGKIVDGMIHDGLWDPYGNVHMGSCGDMCARKYELTREQQDEFARESFRRALAAQKEGLFDAEIEPVPVPQKKGEPIRVKLDEGPGKGDPSKFASLKPAFSKDGTITAANASSINDGASALVLASEGAVKEHKLEPLARIVGYGGAAQAPEWFTTAPAKAIDGTLAKLGMNKEQIDLYEINEAFAAVTMACARLCGLDLQRVNVRGGAVALGHPIGASGARILTTLLYAMRDRGAKRGLATLCIGGGEALAVVVER
jgi:acetyl-CoA C-acetyltransferase